jgi:hypothetical protein
MDHARCHPWRFWIARALALAALSTGLPGCGKETATAPAPPQPPVAGSPKNALLALQWAAEHRDFAVMRTLFADDFVFVFAAQDSAGNAYRDTPWTREDELAFWLHLFEGGSTEPPADRITLDYTNTLTTFPSSRPGHHPTWHKEVRAEVNLRIQRGESSLEVRGPSMFFFVRGDSAAIPQELIDEGYLPDSTRWWIERWEDETISSAATFVLRGPAPATPNPTRAFTWGTIKVLYR